MSNPLNSRVQGTQQPQNAPSAKEQALTLMRRQGIDIPANMENDPNALIQHVMQSGRFPQNRLDMAQQVMQKMFGRR